MYAIVADAAGNGLYDLGGGAFAFIDVEHPEDRLARQQDEDNRDWVDEWEREERLWQETCKALAMPDPDEEHDRFPSWIELHGGMEEF